MDRGYNPVLIYALRSIQSPHCRVCEAVRVLRAEKRVHLDYIRLPPNIGLGHVQG
jgi:hypothetical protein